MQNHIRNSHANTKFFYKTHKERIGKRRPGWYGSFLRGGCAVNGHRPDNMHVFIDPIWGMCYTKRIQKGMLYIRLHIQPWITQRDRRVMRQRGKFRLSFESRWQDEGDNWSLQHVRVRGWLKWNTEKPIQKKTRERYLLPILR